MILESDTEDDSCSHTNHWRGKGRRGKERRGEEREGELGGEERRGEEREGELGGKERRGGKKKEEEKRIKVKFKGKRTPRSYRERR
ncbi:hypothetical protein Pmani_003924 [Petrolisthes manimaculis]|uniref:Uncharacterized protein n=1 Tax=Petrolisthes manimaculis TaxID=1843537 RepID=A0AAE1UHY5_9EUCA|nr:hypothetical protein Pmani_003924 [Petrolisthes manimaculis]